jgi:hypothetical protein
MQDRARLAFQVQMWRVVCFLQLIEEFVQGSADLLYHVGTTPDRAAARMYESRKFNAIIHDKQ